MVLFAELKTETARARPDQAVWLDALAGCESVEARLWRPHDWPEIEKTLARRSQEGANYWRSSDERGAKEVVGPEDRIKAEVDRRIRDMEATGGQKIGRKERRVVHRGMKRELSRGLATMKDGARRDREEASYPNLARRLAGAGLSPSSGTVYLRLGEPAEEGPSRTVWGESEDGLSVFEGLLTVEGHYLVQLPNWWLRADVLRFVGEEEREAYFVCGERVGTGSDGEPLIGEVESVESVPEESVIVAEPGARGVERAPRRGVGGPSGVSRVLRGADSVSVAAVGLG